MGLFPGGGQTVIKDGIVYKMWYAGFDYAHYRIGYAESKNEPPTLPDINGPTSGNAGTEYNYTFTATDPDGDDVYYYVDWDDSNDSGWVGPYSSGQKVTLSHTWFEEGKKTISAIAKM